MKHEKAQLENLARSSSRLNMSMTILLGLTLVLAGFSAWSIKRLIGEYNDLVSIHFTRLMVDIREQDSFLKALVRQSLKEGLLDHQRIEHTAFTPLPEMGPNIFQGQAFPFSLPFTVKLDGPTFRASDAEEVFSQGANLADFYTTFWSASHYSSPQMFLFSPERGYAIAIPAAGRGGITNVEGDIPFIDIIRQVDIRRPLMDETSANGEIAWRSYAESTSYTPPGRVVAYTSISPTSGMNGKRTFVAVSLVDLSQVNVYEQIMARSLYDGLTLFGPSGAVLIGQRSTLSDLHHGVNFTLAGLVFKLYEPTLGGWTAVYTVTYQHIFHYAFWSLVTLGITLLVITGMGLAANRWYQRNVIFPARDAHETIVESEAFSRAVIDAAPTGLCLVRSADHEVLLENQRAQQWDSKELTRILASQPDSSSTNEHRLQISGRYLQVGFVSTRYHGEDVRLYAFNDVTRHVEDAQALEDARRSADAANEAKTLFLATMTHEIRTPLYGVLGTLELLGLTHLDLRQQTYLQTIQRSSATLFQLISDVLDVSKIESGQMALETTAFCPLDIIQDTMRTYSALAAHKGLLFYACTDPHLPAQIVGDPIRIRQILNNFLSNAIKFTDAGRVVLHTRVISFEHEHVCLEWQVIDSGIGISKTQQNRLFELFFQVPEASIEGGAGLGLSICGRLAEMMDGDIKVVSEPGLGSSFSFNVRLPLAQGKFHNCALTPPDPSPVYVRAPIPQLAESFVGWLQRLGYTAMLTIPTEEHYNPEALLVDMLDCSKVATWNGQRICATGDGPVLGTLTENGWRVEMHDVRGIARLIDCIRQGRCSNDEALAPQLLTSLDLQILVAEDNPINQAILKEQLEALGCSTVVAANGEQAVQYWQPGLFDVVLTDVNMPLMNGYELARALRQIDTQIPIIGVTANALRDEGQRCFEAGMNACIVKPLDIQTLRTHLISLCRPAQHDDPGRAYLETAQAYPSNVDIVQLSPAMRELFASTMHDDMQKLRLALEQRNSQRLSELMHSIAGALGAVQDISLANQCCALEIKLADTLLDDDLIESVRALLDKLSRMLSNLT
ncbi:response regulator [Pseudomonas sp. Leaf58]|uniref:response regulator n=1 Tax=Pseudomonas sp. Leaf58 TaxID=1736226 RepID=UPI0007009E43|nr:response regulator [Pseudomonas sp. Leaf58]AYG43801.1 response regulator [Pseudomonas sp. Leaf58]KQN67271.1 two-component system sensor histidine kinase/response regulator [Pseudomonas sp. Leaf58]